MKALVMEEYNHLTYKDVQTPVPGYGEVLIRVMACSVCGSDVHGLDGSTGRRQPPVIMGHEASGIIESCGEGVKNYQPGDRVTFDSTIYCNTCENCKAGLINLCDDRRVLGVSCDEYRQHGAFAEFVVVPEYVLYRLPDHVTFVQASMVEPMSVAYHAVSLAPIPVGGTALVMGVGTIGILAVSILHSLGVKTVIAVDMAEKRLEMAKTCGADVCLNPKTDDVNQQIAELTGGKGVDVSYEMIGLEATINQCIANTKLNGNVVLVGNIAKNVSIPLQVVITHQLTLSGSCASAGEYDKCLELIASGSVDVDAMISKCVPLSEGDYWIRKVYNREDNLDKIVLIPDAYI